MRHGFWVGMVVGGVLAVGMLANAALGGASGVLLPYQGILERNGVGVQSLTPLEFRFRLFDAATGGNACPTTYTAMAPVLNGRFNAVVGPVSEACVVGKEVHVEVTVVNNGTPVPLTGRQRVYPALAAMTSGTGDFRVRQDLLVDGNVSATTVTTPDVFLRGGLGNQGNHVLWNLSGATGESNFVNHRGLGAGGFTFDNTSGNGASLTRLASISSTGNITASGFSGPVTGNVTGNLTGNVTGNVTGQVNGVNLFVKAGNNGTTNCDNYCLNSMFPPTTGACVGARLSNGQYTADCGYSTGGAAPLVCLCARY